MKKKFRMPSQATLNKMHRDGLRKQIPEWQAKVEKTQMRLSKLQYKANREIETLLHLVSMLEVKK